MAEFQCISCGAVRENEKPCICSVCGYKMFETPYERSDVLKQEIRNFIAQLQLNELDYKLLDSYRNKPGKRSKDSGNGGEIILKSTDDQHFPGFETIQKYVCSSSKTEIFLERLETSIEEIRKHISEPYKQNYTVTFTNLKAEVDGLDAVLNEVMPILDIQLELPEITFPDLTLDYYENPDPELLEPANNLLDELSVFTQKIRKFIKLNNIYGTAYKQKPDNKYKPSKDYGRDLQKSIERLRKANEKKYIVDILSDGSDELGEMLEVLWNEMEVITTVPVLKKRYVYHFPDGIIAVDEEAGNKLLSEIRGRYDDLNAAISAENFLSDKSEEELFEIYDQLIELDPRGFMGVNKENLLKIGENEKKLNEMIGLSNIKESIQKIKAYAISNKGSDNLNVHMCFLGNPGTGKTEVARYIAGILYENKILPTNKVVEVDRSGLVSQYFGATAEKTTRVIHSAMGGVLFIDEAYALGNNSEIGISDYGKEAIDTLVKAMEDYRGKFCVIFAGYKNEMEKMLSTNPGLRSRIQFTLDFLNYSRDELQSITELMLKKREYSMHKLAMNRVLDITDLKRKEPNFANAREIRNILDQVIMCQNLRCAGTDDKEVGLVDVNKYIQDAKINLPTSGTGVEKKVLSGEEELDELVGLSSVKRMIKKIKAYAKRNKGDADFNLHMCFYGNPGTGKTEVARILSRILYEAGVLDEAKLVETDGHGLMGKYVGETAPKTKARINEAMGGVLFVDEAYALSGGKTVNGSSNYGEEAIATLLKEMEDHRGQFCVILAGYKDEMQKMLSANPGFESRIQFTLEFPDYTREELEEIAMKFLAKKKYAIEPDAMSLVLDITDYYRKEPNFANARTLRNILDQVIMNQNLRTEDEVNDNTIIRCDVEDYLSDEKIDLSKQNRGSRHMGFV